MNLKKNRWTKIVALVIVLAMVFGFAATGLILALAGGDSGGVTGTYKLKDGTTMKLDKRGIATITVPQVPEPATTDYEATKTQVMLKDPSDPSGEKNMAVFDIQDGNLVDTQGGSGTWVKQ